MSKHLKKVLLSALIFSLAIALAWLGGKWFFAKAIITRQPERKMKLLSAAIAFGNQEAVAARGMEYLELGKPIQAKADFDRVISRSPKYPVAYIYRAEILADMGLLKSALDDYNQALLYLSPYVQSLSKNKDAAEFASEHGSNLAAVSRGLYSRLFRGRIALYSRTGRFGDALVDAMLCVEIDPGDWRNYAARAAVYSFIAQTARARADMKTAVKLGAAKDDFMRELKSFPAGVRKLYADFPASLKSSVDCEDRDEKARNNAKQNYPRVPHCTKG